MAGTFWRIREEHEDFDPYTLYLDKTTFFTLKICHGGQFTKSPGREYVNGNTTFIDFVDYEVFGSKALNEMIYRIGYASDMVFYYHFKIPYVCLDLGLNLLSSDSDFKSLGDHVRGGAKLIEIYVEQWHSTILMMSLVEDGPSNARDVALYTMSSIAKDIEPMIQSNPEIPLLALQDVIQKKQQVQVSLDKAFRAKTIATFKLFGDYAHQYSLLRSYGLELLRANPGSTVTIDVNPCCNPILPTRQFRRIYICFDAMKKGFKMCGREILGLDGCFMKGPYPGQILTAVGVDGNNGIYPVAFSLVEAETFETWKWFLEALRDDLELPSDANLTFISDRQKGIIPALGRVFPRAEHRFCPRHIHENMKKKWRGDVFKNLLWRAASVTSIPYFNKAMDDNRNQDASLYEWLKLIPPTSWSRAHFSGRPKCDMLLNNICEVFNKQLIGARDKPVITYLEYIREYMTKRIVNVKKIQAKCEGPLTPNATTIFNSIKKEASQMNVLMVDSSKYQMSGPRSQCVVNVNLKTCLCRKWDLSGMPCKHAVTAIWDMARNDLRVGIPENWVSEVYWLDTWKKVYMNVIDPITGPEMWTPSQCPTTLIPPKHHKQVGRPKKKRKKSIEEVQEGFSSKGKMTRKGNTTICKKCGNKGHNSRTCKGQGGEGSQHQYSQNATQGAPQPSQDSQEVNI